MPAPSGSPLSLLSHPAPQGTLIAGKFRVDRVLGQGGNGIVAAATHVILGRPVALKFLLPQAQHKGEVVARFLREARIAVSIRSPHVVEVLDAGILETGEPYLAMELLQGTDLGQYLSKRGPLPLAEAIDYALQACEGLAEAHARGVVHRDVKPANFFLVRGSDGSPLLKVLDFGICKAPAENLDAITQTGAALGSPAYMSPEQIRSTRKVDNRTDQWSLGVTLYEMLEGHLPFSAEAMPEMFLKIVSEPPAEHQRADLPAELRAVIARCLGKSASERYPDIAALARALSHFGDSGAVARADRIGRILGLFASTLKDNAPGASLPPAAPLSALPPHQTLNPSTSSHRPDALTPGAGTKSRLRRAMILMATVTVGLPALLLTMGKLRSMLAEIRPPTANSLAMVTGNSDLRARTSPEAQTRVAAPERSASGRLGDGSAAPDEFSTRPPPGLLSATPSAKPMAARPPRKLASLPAPSPVPSGPTQSAPAQPGSQATATATATATALDSSRNPLRDIRWRDDLRP